MNLGLMDMIGLAASLVFALPLANYAVVRLFAGEVAPTGDMKVQTPIATMGIRGTTILGVNVNSLGGRLSLAQDPDGSEGLVEILQNGDLFTVLDSIFSKITLGNDGTLMLSAKTPEELAFDLELTQSLHDFYENLGPPETDEPSLQPQTGSPFFRSPNFREIDFGQPDTLEPETITLPSELLVPFVESLLQNPDIQHAILQNLQEAPPETAELALGFDEAATIPEGATIDDQSLPFSFGASGPGTVGFAALDGQPSIDADGNQVESGGTALTYSWDADQNVLRALAGEETIFTIAVEPDTGALEITLTGSLDHLADPDNIGLDLTFTVTAANGESVTGTLTLNVADDEPVAVDDAPEQLTEGTQGIADNVLANDEEGADGATLTHVELGDSDGFRAITSGQETSPGSGVFIFATAAGTYTFAASGAWSFEPAPGLDNNEQPFDASFAYRITDSDQDISEATQPISIADGELAVTDATDAIVVDEANLPGGTNPDDAASTLTGSFADNFDFGGDGKGEVLQIIHNGETYTPDESGEINISNGDWTFTVQATGEDAGDYTFVLNDNTLAHGFADNGPNSLSLPTFEATMTDGDGTEGTVSLNVDILDDVPRAVSDVAVASAEEGAPSYNIGLILDLSGSMGSGENSRLQLMKDAVTNLLTSTNVASVFIVGFASDAEHHPASAEEAWFTDIDAVTAIINELSDGGGTDYDAALRVFRENYDTPPEAANKTVVYFLSDGMPNQDDGTGTDGIVGEEIGVWESFLSNNSIDEVFAFGIGDGVSTTELEPIAFPNNDPDNPLVITNPNDLSDTLSETTTQLFSGNVLTGEGGVNEPGADNFGADGPGGVRSITIDGTTYSFDGENIVSGASGDPLPSLDEEFVEGENDIPFAVSFGSSLFALTDQGGLLIFHFDDRQFGDGEAFNAGDWQYLPPAFLGQGQEGYTPGEDDELPFGEPPTLPYENFRYTVEDGDGDTSTASLTIITDPGEIAAGNVHQGTSDEDILEGNPEAPDILVGNPGADTFVLNGLPEGENGDLGEYSLEIFPPIGPFDGQHNDIADYIADYNVGEGDVIDLSALLEGKSAEIDPENVDQFVKIVEQGEGAVDALKVNTGSGEEATFQTVALFNGDAGANILIDDSGSQAQV
jgi:uncharacterized protein YegL